MKQVINLQQRFTEHFVLGEFVSSPTAEAHKIPNTPLKCHITALENLCVRCLEPTRQHFGWPITIGSGYRCPKLNALVGGVDNSQHMKGEAADVAPLELVSDSKIQDELTKMVEIIKENGKWDQMIIYPTFVHVSWKRFGPNRHQILRKITSGYQKA